MNRAALILLGSIVATAASAANSPLPDGPYVIADGSSEIDVAPDFAIIPFSIENTADAASKAAPAVQEKTLKLFKLLHDLGIPGDDIGASDVKVNPDYEFEGNKEVFKGMQVRRDFKVTLHDLTKYSQVMQGLLDLDVDDLSDVQFGSAKERDFKTQALDKAMDDARAIAETMAKHEGMRVNRMYAVASSEYRSSLTDGFPLKPTTVSLGMTERVRSKAALFIVQKAIDVSYQVTVVYTLSAN